MGEIIINLMPLLLFLVVFIEVVFCAFYLKYIFRLVKLKKTNKKNSYRIKPNSFEATSIMIRKIFLKNQWENINEMVDILRKNDIHIDFRLG